MGTLRKIAATVIAVAALACGTPPPPPLAPPPAAEPPRIDPDGGMPAEGPGDLYNGCERIFCLEHRRNYALDHFLVGHLGWIVHDDAHGDVFVPSGRTDGPAFTGARPAALRLCGRHLHPFVLGTGTRPILDRGWRAALGYDHAHFRAFGIRLEPCCLNGLGWGYLHAPVPRQFRFDDLELYRGTTSGWQKPFPARAG